jgi:hypothetical protein
MSSRWKRISKVYDDVEMSPKDKRIALDKLYEQLVIDARKGLGKPAFK